jgi:hypothetical protein
MPQEAQAPINNEYVKIPNVPGLYRHVQSWRHHGVKKVNGKRKECSFDTTDRRTGEAAL